MPKKIIQDIVIKRKKITAQKKSKKTTTKSVKETKSSKKNTSKIIFWSLFVFLFVILGVKVISIFSNTVIKITPKQETVSVDTIVSGLILKTMEIETEKTRSVRATGSKNIEKSASGQIVVYNTYSPQTQTLVKNTRFETLDGKIYRIESAISIPGTKWQNGKLVPGSLEVTVYADKPGEEYNIGYTDFTIPGFKGTARYEKFYARSKTPMAGGAIGIIPIIPEGDFENTKKEMEEILKKELLSKAILETPEDYLLYEKGTKIEFKKDSETIEIDSDSSKATIKKGAKLTAFLVPRTDLSNFLVEKYFTKDLVNKTSVSNIESLSFELISGNFETKTMIFRIRGDADFVWKIQDEQLKEALIASSKDIKSTFGSFPEIEEASVVFNPPWWQFFPKKTSKITIEKVLTP